MWICNLGDKGITGDVEVRERGKKEGERESVRTECRTMHKKNTYPKPLMVKMRGANNCKTLQTPEPKD